MWRSRLFHTKQCSCIWHCKLRGVFGTGGAGEHAANQSAWGKVGFPFTAARRQHSTPENRLFWPVLSVSLKFSITLLVPSPQAFFSFSIRALKASSWTCSFSFISFCRGNHKKKKSGYDGAIFGCTLSLWFWHTIVPKDRHYPSHTFLFCRQSCAPACGDMITLDRISLHISNV